MHAYLASAFIEDDFDVENRSELLKQKITSEM